MRRLFSLGKRLETVAELVPEGARLADIGTDHGFLPVHLLCTGKIRTAVAADIGEKPLSHAAANAERFGARGLALRLCDGLSGLSPDEADTIVIAGMGGETILDILSAAPWTRGGRHRLILQPMSGAQKLRAFLYRSGYLLEDERIAREGRRLYPVLLARGAGESPADAQAGPAGVYVHFSRPLSLRGGPDAALYLSRVRKNAQSALAGLRSRGEDTAPQEALLSELDKIREDMPT